MMMQYIDCDLVHLMLQLIVSQHEGTLNDSFLINVSVDIYLSFFSWGRKKNLFLDFLLHMNLSLCFELNGKNSMQLIPKE